MGSGLKSQLMKIFVDTKKKVVHSVLLELVYHHCSMIVWDWYHVESSVNVSLLQAFCESCASVRE